MIPFPGGRSLGTRRAGLPGFQSEGESAPLDALLRGAHTASDEFDAGPSLNPKWRRVGVEPNAASENLDNPRSLHLRRDDTSSLVTCYYQPAPTFPCEIITKVTDNAAVNFCRGGGIFVLPANPTTASPAYFWGTHYDGRGPGNPSGRSAVAIQYATLSTFGGRPGFANTIGFNTSWYRMTIRAGGTTADLYYSTDGIYWNALLRATALGFTVANIGLAFAPEGQSGLRTTFDFFRVGV